MLTPSFTQPEAQAAICTGTHRVRVAAESHESAPCLACLLSSMSVQRDRDGACQSSITPGSPVLTSTVFYCIYLGARYTGCAMSWFAALAAAFQLRSVGFSYM